MKGMKKVLGVLSIIVCALFLVPNNVNAEEISSEFKTLLTDSGKLKVNGAKPDRMTVDFLFEYMFLLDENGEYADTGYSWNNFSEDVSTVDFTINTGKSNEETHTVEIEYVYDKNIKTMVDGYLKKIPADLEYFNVRDMEVINFWVNGKGDDRILINYSSELKNYFDYKNFAIDLRMGMSDRLLTYASGVANFSYDKVFYGIKDGVGVSAKHVLYVDENTGTTKEELISAIQKRIDNYIGKNKVKVTFGGESVYNLYVDEFDENITYYETELATITSQLEEARRNETNLCANDTYNEECMNAQNLRAQLEMQKMQTERNLSSARDYKNFFLNNYNNEDGDYYFLKDAVNGYYFNAEIGEDTYSFIIVKDNDKMLEPSTKTTDVKTDVTISTANTTLPLDTTIRAEELTSGTEYDRIIKILNVSDNLTFDLKLYSNSLGEYITKLSDGTFEVKIPIPENFKGKDLIVYYVDSNSKVIPYKVTPENGYAKFVTDHFSIYSLAEKKSAVSEENPQTYDGIVNSIFVGTISLIGLLGTILYFKKKSNIKGC